MATALLVLLYPQRHQQRLEARSRLFSTAAGGIWAFMIVVLTSLQPDPLVLVISVFLGVLWFGWRMINDPDRVYTHQLAMTIFVLISLASFTGINPIMTMLDRLALTLGGGAFALLAMFLLRWIFARSTMEETHAGDYLPGQRTITRIDVAHRQAAWLAWRQ